MSRDPKTSRGFRNRNPGNIDWNPNNKWQGQIGREETGNPPRFAVFQSHEFGIRALAVLLTTYQDRHGLRTVAGIINRWAPPSGSAGGKAYSQNTEAYIHAVSRALGVSASHPIDVHTYAHMRPLVQAIITHELGGNPYDGATIDEGLRLAGIPRPVTTLAEAARTGTGRAAIQGVTVTAAVAAAVEAVPAIEAVGKLPQWMGVAIILAVAAVTVAVLLSRRTRA